MAVVTRRFKLVVAYLGTGFSGWQRQRGARTVQDELESALARFVRAKSPPKVVAAGRTDAGVHAAGQVAHVDLPAGIDPATLARGLATRLPHDLRVVSAVVASEGFHARYDAVAKRYVYRLAHRRSTRPWADLRHAVVAAPLDTDRLARVLERFLGRRDVASFSVTDPGVRSTVRTLAQASCRVTPRGAVLTFVGDGFLRYQVRRMVGAAIDVASGVHDLGWIDRLLAAPTPGARIRTAPANGLTLDRVWYRRPKVLDSLW